MKSLKSCLVLIGASVALHAVAVPIVSNVQMQQIAGTKDVRITYDLADNFNTQLWVTVSARPTNSVPNWGTAYFPMGSVEGDVRCWVTPGTGKEIIWHAGTDWNGLYTEFAKATVVATAKSNMFNGNLKFTGSRSSAGVYYQTVTFLSTKVHGSGTLSFSWEIDNYSSSKSSSVSSLYLYVDGVLVRTLNSSLSTGSNTSSEEYEFKNSGYHTVEWKYYKKVNYTGYYGRVYDLNWR